MQDPFSIWFFIIPFIIATESYGGKERLKKEWSTLLDEGSSSINGIGTWKVRFMPHVKEPYDAKIKPETHTLNSSQKNTKQGNETFDDDVSTNKLDAKNFKNTDGKGVENDDYNNLNFTEKNDTNFRNDEYSGRSFLDNKENDTFQSVFENWIGNQKKNTYWSTNFSQPAWELPVSKLNELNEVQENITVFPLSVLHNVWRQIEQVRRIGKLEDSKFDLENEPSINITLDTSRKCANECLAKRTGNEIQEGDLDTNETDRVQERMGGGGQPILLIKGDGGGSDAGPWQGSNGKESVGPLIMMMTPLIMMCIMIPMMMSVMGGMMNFMKNMTSMMIMMNWPQNGAQPLVTKQRKTGEVDHTNDFLNSFILELSERLEEALNKYDE